MMEWRLFLKGVIIGFSIAAPVGPIGILCIQRTLSGGNIQGLATGLGAATADAIYGFMAAFGLTLISDFLVDQSFWFRIIGGIFLCYLGIRAFSKKPSSRGISVANSTALSAYGTTFFLTLTNPMTILFFAGIFAGLGVVSESVHYASAGLMVIGVFLGSAVWWLLLSGITGIFHHKISEGKLALVNKISAAIILAFGVAALFSVVV
ncbi:MAG: LysE family transporter [Desulfobacterales bacterium]|jgi:threonine/homoserine/homoserine lactone efflux protein